MVNAADDIWVFGDDALSLHYDGKEWTRVDNPLSRRKAVGRAAVGEPAARRRTAASPAPGTVD